MKYGEYEVSLKINKYLNGNLYVGMDYFDKEFGCMCPYGDITVNLIDLPKGHAAIDTNNMGTAVLDFLKKYKLAEPIGLEIPSGFCMFPVYKFNEMELRKYLG